MGYPPHRSAASALSAVAIAAFAQPALLLKNSVSAQEIEFTPQAGNQVVESTQGSYSRTPTTEPLASSTFTPAEATPALPVAPPDAGTASIPNATVQAGNAPEELPAIPVPSQPAIPQPAPGLAANSPAVPTSYDYRRPTTVIPTSSAFVSKGQLPEGTVIPVATFRDTKFDLSQEVQVNLSVARDVADSQGRTIVPAGSSIWGRFEPIMSDEKEMVGNYERTRKRIIGSQFVAERIEIQAASHPISGQSNHIPSGIDPDADVDRIALKSAGFGTLGGIALGVLTGGAGFLPLMAIGGMSGAMAGAATVNNVVAIDADTVLEIQLDKPFVSN